jgi:L-ribulose-5-phosphate 3-epimerase
MKKAINQWCFPADWDWPTVFSLCGQAGFEGLELSIDYAPFFEAMRRTPGEGLIAEIAKSVGSTFSTSKSLQIDSSEADIRSVAALAHDHGVQISSVLTISQFHYSLIDGDPTVRQTGIDLVRRLLDIAAVAGAPNVLVVPGVVTSRIDYEDAYRRLVDALAELKPIAEERGVGLGLENVWGRFLYSPIEMRDLVDKLGSPYVGVHFDVGNVMQYGYPDQWIRLLAGRLLSIHLKDFVDEIGNIRGFTHLFQGDVPWESVMRALRDVGYDGYLIAEVPPYRFAPDEGIRDISRKLDILLGLS